MMPTSRATRVVGDMLASVGMGTISAKKKKALEASLVLADPYLTNSSEVRGTKKMSR